MWIIALSLVASGIGGILIANVVYRALHRHGRHASAGAVSVIVGLLTFCILLAIVPQWLCKTAQTTYIDIDPREGARLLEHYGPPIGAVSDFCYHSYWAADGFNITADFNMSEADYLAWMKSTNRKVRPLGRHSSEVVFAVRSKESRVLVKVRRGYSYSVDLADESSRVTILYDLDAHRVYFEKHSY